MNISISISAPASERRPAVIIDGRGHRPQDKAPDGKTAAAHLRQALYSGRIPAADWPAAERVLLMAQRARIGAVGGVKGGKAKGAAKRRGGAAWYKWVTACREAKRAGLPAPPKPAVRAGKAKPR